MIHKKILSLLVLLMTAASGAWAQTQWTSGDCTVTLNNGTLTVSGNGAMTDYINSSDRPWDGNRNDITGVVVESGVTSVRRNAFESFTNLTSVTLPEGLTAIGLYAFSNCSSLQSITIPSTVTSIGEGAFDGCLAMTSVTLPEGLTAIGASAFGSCSSLTSITIPSTVTSIGDYAFMKSKAISDVNLYANPDNLTWGITNYDFKQSKATKCHVLAEHLSAYQNNFSSVNVTFVGDLQPLATSEVDVTTNKAQGETTFTEATFAMPAFDATVDYDIVRDLATSTKVDLIIGTGSDAVTATADTRLRIAKSNNVYAPVSALSCNFVDQIENNTILPTGFADAKLTPQFYLQGENDAWTLVTDINTTTKLPNNLQPGQVYYITLKAADGSYYDGETQPSYTVTLFEGYEVAVPAGEYVTYFRDEPLYADPVSSADAKLYTVSSVSTTDGTATLSDAIATAPSSTPLLVYNAGNTDATFLLIPADAEPNLALTVAPEFIGTTEATTIAASTSTKNNYAFNGKQFVWVKDAISIAANKAWLEIGSGELQARTITLVFDETTKITNTNITNITNGNWYDLNGRKLQNIPTKKGVYIFNGRKVVIK